MRVVAIKAVKHTYVWYISALFVLAIQPVKLFYHNFGVFLIELFVLRYFHPSQHTPYKLFVF